MTQYHFHLEKFQGPLDLLLQLITERKLKITDVSLAKVADQYLEHIKTHKVDPEDLSSFLVVAARLLLIKSKEILPQLELTQEEEEDIEDFKIRLVRYKKYKFLALELRELEKRGEYSLCRQLHFGRRICFSPPAGVTPEALQRIFERVLAEFPLPPKLEKRTITETLSLEEKIFFIEKILEERIVARFVELKQKGDQLDYILTFLALLELARQGRVGVKQRRAFGEISIYSQGRRGK